MDLGTAIKTIEKIAILIGGSFLIGEVMTMVDNREETKKTEQAKEFVR